MKTILMTLHLLVTIISTHQQDERREPKWFLGRRTLTSVVLQRRLITEMIPSSCAVVEPTLQPCRNVRRLDIKPTPPRKMQSTEAPAISQQVLHHKKPPVEPSSDGGSWLWGGVTTVTQVLVSDMTVKVQDPNTVVTFSVKGCKPTRLPFDLPYCHNNIDSNNTSITSSAHIMRTADLHYIQD